MPTNGIGRFPWRILTATRQFRQNKPSGSDVFNHLGRWSLERNFDRTLSQLERVQRMRLGQPVLRKLEVHHSMSSRMRGRELWGISPCSRFPVSRDSSPAGKEGKTLPSLRFSSLGARVFACMSLLIPSVNWIQRGSFLLRSCRGSVLGGALHLFLVFAGFSRAGSPEDSDRCPQFLSSLVAKLSAAQGIIPAVCILKMIVARVVRNRRPRNQP